MNTQPTKPMPCSECGKPVTVNAQTVNAPRCYNCGMTAAQEAIRQMHEKSGPYYDRWLSSNARGARGKGRTTPSDDTGDEPLF